MIVYSGKQYGNDFNNGDEGLFQDANRPRDNDKFKLRPGLQSDKWDWRSTNKNTALAMIYLKGFSRVGGTSSGNNLNWKPIQLKESWSSSEISSLAQYGATTDSIKLEKYGDPFVRVKSGTITYATGSTTDTIQTDYLEVVKSGLYSVTVYGAFYFDTDYYNSTYGYQYKERVGIAQPSDNGVYVNTDRTQARATGNGDNLRLMQIGWYEAGAELLPIAAHSLTSGTNYVVGGVSMARLG